MGVALPDCELTNEFLHEEVGLRLGPDWAKSRLGIFSRFTVLSKDYIKATKNRDPNAAMLLARSNGLTPVTLGVRAARAALEAAGVGPERIGWVIANNDTPLETIPSTAAFLAKALGIGGGPHCDVNSACSSFARHMKLLCDMRPEALPEFVLCVQSSCYTMRTDYGERSADGYIWGDGACAQVVSARHPGRIGVEALAFETDPAGAEEIVIDSAGHFSQNGAKVREFSIRKTCELFEAIAERKGLFAETTYTVAHQANYVMQNSILGHLNLPEDRHLRNVQTQGNIAAAGCPSVIAQNWDRFHAGDKLIYAVVGSGLAWGGGYMEVH